MGKVAEVGAHMPRNAAHGTSFDSASACHPEFFSRHVFSVFDSKSAKKTPF